MPDINVNYHLEGAHVKNIGFNFIGFIRENNKSLYRKELIRHIIEAIICSKITIKVRS